MLSWIISNLGTIVVGIILLVAVTSIVYKQIKNRKAGKPSCNCGCADCPLNGKCH